MLYPKENWLPRPKQHHYVTRAYLAGFLMPGSQQLYCYGRKVSPFKKSPDELCKHRNFYSLRNEDGSWDDSLEELIGRTIEAEALPILRRLCIGKTRLIWEERRTFALMIAFQETRTPAAREQARLQSKLMNDQLFGVIRASSNPGQTSISIIEDEGRSSEMTLEDMVTSHEVLCDDNAREIHQTLARSAVEFQRLYAQMKMTLYFPLGKGSFITTDTPVIRVFYDTRPLGAGLNRPDIEVRFPLSCNAFLTIKHDMPRIEAQLKKTARARAKKAELLPEIRIRYLNDESMLKLNKGHARHARRWIFSPEPLDWAQDLLATPSAAPEVVDLSTRDLMHFHAKVKYDPITDSLI